MRIELYYTKQNTDESSYWLNDPEDTYWHINRLVDMIGSGEDMYLNTATILPLVLCVDNTVIWDKENGLYSENFEKIKFMCAFKE